MSLWPVLHLWTMLWKTPDQQAMMALKQQHYETAAAQFINPDWKAAALYRAGHYQQAATLYKTHASLENTYNLGNALAHLKRYREALAAYQKVLAAQPHHADALANKKIIEDLLKQQPPPPPPSSSPKAQTPKSPEPNDQKPNPSPPTPGQSSPKAPAPPQKARDQWLQLIPDHPGGLLRQQFLRDHLKRRKEAQ